MLEDRIKQAVREKGTTVFQMEKDLGFARGAIYKWDESSPAVDRLVKVAKYLEKPIAWFLEDEEQ